MAGNSFGQCLRITTAGESHGPAEVVIIDGCPPGLPLEPEHFESELARRRPGQSAIVSQRRESDRVEILGGVFEGKTTGTPLALLVRNEDAKSEDYAELKDVFRPGHADYTYQAKYGIRDPRGGGRASARETVVRVAAGVVARVILRELCGAEVLGYVVQVGSVRATVPDPTRVTLQAVEQDPTGAPNVVRCPDPVAASEMRDLIEAARKAQDSIGGIAELCATGVPVGLGEPVFDKLKADLGKALFSIPAVVGVEFGAGFAASSMHGSEHNDAFRMNAGRVITTSNHHGGILGGISSGMPIVMRAAIKPTSSLPREQPTVTHDGRETTVRTKGRHDPCLLPRFVPVAEAMVALVLADHVLRARAQGCPPDRISFARDLAMRDGRRDFASGASAPAAADRGVVRYAAGRRRGGKPRRGQKTKAINTHR